MKNKLFRLLAAAALTIASIGITAAPVSAHQQTCQDGSFVNEHIGEINYEPTLNQTGVQATLTGFPSMQFCTTTSDNDRGPSVWVSLYPRDGGDENDIVQVGVEYCASNVPTTYDDGQCEDNYAHWFYAVGGCGNFRPFPHDLGRINLPYQPTSIKVTVTSTTVGFWIGGVAVHTISTSDSRISCWITDAKEASWMGERWDGGDSFGSANYRVQLDNMTYATGSPLNYHFPTLSTTCSYDPAWGHAGYCPTVNSTHSMDIYD